LKILKTHTWNA